MVGAVGDDDAGRAYVERLRGAGHRRTSGVAVLDDEPTGTALIVGRRRRREHDRGRAGRQRPRRRTRRSRPSTRPAPDDVLLVQLEIPLDTVAEACARAAARGVRVVLNIAPYADLPADGDRPRRPGGRQRARGAAARRVRRDARLAAGDPRRATARSGTTSACPPVEVPDDEVARHDRRRRRLLRRPRRGPGARRGPRGSAAGRPGAGAAPCATRARSPTPRAEPDRPGC